MTAAQKHKQSVAEVGCVICLEHCGVKSPCEVHHIGEGSGHRSDFMVAGLCAEHHRGCVGIHGMGVKAFLKLYKLPTEYHLIGLVNKYLGQ